MGYIYGSVFDESWARLARADLVTESEGYHRVNRSNPGDSESDVRLYGSVFDEDVSIAP